MLKYIFYDSFEISKFTRVCMENQLRVTGWQELFFSYKSFQFSVAIAIPSFKRYSQKIPGYLILICSFGSC